MQPVTRKEVVAWALCDWANSAYSTLLITFVVAYIQRVVLPGDAGVRVYGWGLGLSMFLAAWLSPICGAMADARANKRTWLLTTSFAGAVCAVGMAILSPQSNWTPLLLPVLFFAANLCFELSFGFYNGFLPELADDDNMNHLSGIGYAAGYFGGGLALALAMVALSVGRGLGFSSGDCLRFGLGLMGVWWAVFTIPAALWLYDRRAPKAARESLLGTARTAIGEVFATLTHIRMFSVLALFLLGFLLYNEGIQTVMSQASVFAEKVLKMEPAELGGVVLMIQFVATPAALGVSWLAGRIGGKVTLTLCLVIWCALLGCAYFVTTTGQFWMLGVVLALVMGGTQSVSRYLMGQMTPVSKSGEFFGFFNLSCRATSMVGPILFSEILVATGSANLAILSLMVFIIAGLLVVLRVNVRQGVEQAAKADAASS